MCREMQTFLCRNVGLVFYLGGTGPVPCAPPCRGQINAAQQQRQFLVRERDLRPARPDFRPPETASLQPFRTNPRAVFIMPNLTM